MQVSLQLVGSKCTLVLKDVPKELTLGELKGQLQKEERVPSSLLTLIHGGKKLEDGTAPLSQFSSKGECSLQVSPKINDEMDIKQLVEIAKNPRASQFAQLIVSSLCRADFTLEVEEGVKNLSDELVQKAKGRAPPVEAPVIDSPSLPLPRKGLKLTSANIEGDNNELRSLAQEKFPEIFNSFAEVHSKAKMEEVETLLYNSQNKDKLIHFKDAITSLSTVITKVSMKEDIGEQFQRIIGPVHEAQTIFDTAFAQWESVKDEPFTEETFQLQKKAVDSGMNLLQSYERAIDQLNKIAEENNKFHPWALELEDIRVILISLQSDARELSSQCSKELESLEENQQAIDEKAELLITEEKHKIFEADNRKEELEKHEQFAIRQLQVLIDSLTKLEHEKREMDQKRATAEQSIESIERAKEEASRIVETEKQKREKLRTDTNVYCNALEMVSDLVTEVGDDANDCLAARKKEFVEKKLDTVKASREQSEHVWKLAATACNDKSLDVEGLGRDLRKIEKKLKESRNPGKTKKLQEKQKNIEEEKAASEESVVYFELKKDSATEAWLRSVNDQVTLMKGEVEGPIVVSSIECVIDFNGTTFEHPLRLWELENIQKKLVYIDSLDEDERQKGKHEEKQKQELLRQAQTLLEPTLLQLEQ